jgi:hypothetical protein
MNFAQKPTLFCEDPYFLFAKPEDFFVFFNIHDQKHIV